MLLQQMDDRVQVKRDWFVNYKFHLVSKVEQVAKLVDICVERGICSLDLETTGVDNRVYPDEFFEDGRTTRHGIRTVDKVVGICMSFDGENGYYIPVGHEAEDAGNLPWDETWDEITRLVNACRIIFHNKRFDAEFLYPLTKKDFWNKDEFEDTFLIAKVISPLKSNPAGLKTLAKLHFGIEMVELDELFTDEKREQLKRRKQKYNFGLLHPSEGLEYACSDGIFTYKEFFASFPRLQGGDKMIYDLEKSFTNVMQKMERNRIHIDVDRVNQLYTECKRALLDVGDLIREMVEERTGQTGKWLTLNVGSPQKLSACLFTDQEGLRLKPTPEMVADGEGGWGTNYEDDDHEDEYGKVKQYSLKDEVLKSLHRYYGPELSVQRTGVVDRDGNPRQESLFELILEWRHYDKMKGSYVEKLFKSHDKYGDVRPSFNQMGTETARLSSKAGKIEDGYSGVNFQGIPRDSDDDKPELFKQIRTCIAPRPGWLLVKIDYSGEELRVVTNMSGDPVWTKSFLYEDGDVHSITTRTLFGRQNITKDERTRGKRCNFAFIYGGGAGAIARNVGCSMEDGQRHMDNLRRDVPVLMGYVDHQKKFARKNKCIFTAFGRRMPIPTIDSPIRGIRAKAERCAINYTIQATSADILKFAMCYVDKQIRERGWEDKVRYVLTVHDEIVFEVRPDAIMEVVPLLDEWMVLPWKLPKAHGRDWIVPLETEPGIDVHWRARFDFFDMTRGKKADPDDVAEDGTFKGKLKDGQYFADGRVYQEIPDFLKGHVRRLPLDEDGEPILDAAEDRELDVPDPPLELPPRPEPKTLPEPREEPGPPDPEPEEESGKPDPPDPEAKEGSVRKEEPPPSEAGSAPGNGAGAPVGFTTDVDLDIGDPDFASGSASEPPESEGGQDSIPDSIPDPDPPKRPVKKTKPIKAGEKILRWTFKTVYSEEAMRKLHAVCILTEGDTPLRIINHAGEVIVPETEGLRVHPENFQFLASMFGLG